MDGLDQPVQGIQSFVDSQRLYNIAPMKTVLVIDTATDLCSVACRHAGRVFEDTRSVHRSHNTQLLGMLDQLCGQAGCTPRQLDAIGFVAGPGSFTGIRIAAAVSQALRLASGATLLALNSADLLASTARSGAFGHGFDTGLVTILPSRRDRYYCAQFEPRRAATDSQRTVGPAQLTGLRRVIENRLLDGEQVVSLVRQALNKGAVAVALGHGVDEAGLTGLFALQSEPDLVLQQQPITVSGTRLLRHACDLFDAQPVFTGIDSPAPEDQQLLAGLPIYVEGDTPWQPK